MSSEQDQIRTQTAIAIPTLGEAIAAVSVSRPGASSLPAAHVAVHVTVAGINNIDTIQARTGSYIQEYPYILGREWTGIVTKVGTDVGRLRVGDKVTGVGYTQPSSALQENIILPEMHVARIPEGSSLSEEEIATIPHNFTASFMALFSPSVGLGLPVSTTSNDKSTPILIWGASGSTGSYALQTLRHFEFSCLYAVAGPSALPVLEAAGVKGFDRTRPRGEIVQFVRDAGVKLVYVTQADSAGWEAILGSVDLGSRISYISAPYEGEVPAGITLVRAVSFFIVNDHVIGDALISEHLQGMLEAGAVKPAKKVNLLTDGSLLDRVREGFELLSSGLVRENIAVKVGE